MSVLRHLYNISPFIDFLRNLAWSASVQIPTVCHWSTHSTGSTWYLVINVWTNACIALQIDIDFSNSYIADWYWFLLLLHCGLKLMKLSCFSPRWRSQSRTPSLASRKLFLLEEWETAFKMNEDELKEDGLVPEEGHFWQHWIAFIIVLRHSNVWSAGIRQLT